MSDFSYVPLINNSGLYLPKPVVDQITRMYQARTTASAASAIAGLYKSRATADAGRLFSDFSRFGGSLRTIGPGLEKPADGVPFDVLRSLADTSPIDRVIIDTRIMQIKRVARRALGRNSIGFAVRHVRDTDSDFNVPEGIKKLCREIEDVINSPTAPFHDHIGAFFTAAVEEELVLDRKAMVLARDRQGRPRKFHLVDGATIKPVPAILFQYIKDHYDRTGDVLSQDQAIEYLWMLYDIDLTQKAYVQEVDAKIVAAWADDEMSVDITNPTVRLNRWGYGRSLLEKSFRLSDAFLKTWTFNTSLFDQSYPEQVLGIIGNIDPDGLEVFKRLMMGEDGNTFNWRLPIIPLGDKAESDLKPIKLRDTPREMMFDQFLTHIVNLKCAAFRMHPSMVNWSGNASGGDGISFQTNASQETQITQAQEEGFKSLLESLADWITRTIVREYHEDLRFVWVGLDQETEEAKIQQINSKIQSFLTINEGRKEYGLQPLPDELPTKPGDFVGNYSQAISTLMQQQQQAQQAQNPDGQENYDQGDFGADGDDDEAPWWQANQKPNGQKNVEQAPQNPQAGGPQHPDEEGEPLGKSTRFLRLRVRHDYL